MLLAKYKTNKKILKNEFKTYRYIKIITTQEKQQSQSRFPFKISMLFKSTSKKFYLCYLLIHFCIFSTVKNKQNFCVYYSISNFGKIL